jgi:hypothetical protein
MFRMWRGRETMPQRYDHARTSDPGVVWRSAREMQGKWGRRGRGRRRPIPSAALWEGGFFCGGRRGPRIENPGLRSDVPMGHERLSSCLPTSVAIAVFLVLPARRDCANAERTISASRGGRTSRGSARGRRELRRSGTRAGRGFQRPSRARHVSVLR